MSVTVTVEEFREIYATFLDGSDIDYSDAVIQAYLDLAADTVGLDRYRVCLKTEAANKAAIYALTAHLLFMASQGASGASGPMTSASEGSVSVGWASVQITRTSWYQQSPYGQLFWQIMAPCRVGGCQFTPRNYHPWG